ALEVHLENADQAKPRGDVLAEGHERVVARELEVGAVAGELGISADLPPDEPGEHFTVWRREAMEGPDRVVAARNVFLECELRRELAYQRLCKCGVSIREHAGFAHTAEQVTQHARAFPCGPQLRLDEHRTALGFECRPFDAARDRQALRLGERLKA